MTTNIVEYINDIYSDARSLLIYALLKSIRFIV